MRDGINDGGQIVRWRDAPVGTERGFLYGNGVMENLGTLGDLPMTGYSEAYAINRSGHVVGTSTLATTSYQPRGALEWGHEERSRGCRPGQPITAAPWG